MFPLSDSTFKKCLKLHNPIPSGKKKQEMFQLHKPAGISQLSVSVRVRRKKTTKKKKPTLTLSQSLGLNIFHLSHTFCGGTAGLLLLPVMKSVNYWPPAAALWISTLHSLCDLQRQQKYTIALTHNTKTCRWS